DVSFHEDDSRVRTGHGPENLARLRRLALNLLRTHGDKHSKRKSIRGRRKVAAWDHDFLLKLIAG
ncbi:MAG: ISAs1 family transposase, partial [Planctomycetota bacterium]|nr:ISAs1 family transposase [Planctomycetota bacterium]